MKIMMSKVVHIRYTFAMAIIDDIYANVDDFGLVTSAEAKEFGIPNTELVQQERRGKLVRVARGVYRMPVWPHQEAAPYAIAVKAAGEGAYLWGESVVALLGLTPTDPTRIWVASPRRIRRDVGQGVTVLGMRQGESITHYEGVRCQRAADAIRAAAPRLGRERAREAAETAQHEGYITSGEMDDLREELS